MGGKIIKYFATGNTAYGFYNLLDSTLEGLDRIFILKGGPGTGKSTLMKMIANNWILKGYQIELIYCSSDSRSIDGVIIPALKAGVVDGTAPHVIEPKAPGAIEEYVNLGVAWNRDKLSLEKERILTLQEKVNEHYRQAYDSFAAALKTHDEWERIYIQNMDFKKADILTEQLKQRIFTEQRLEKESVIKRRFFGAATPIGPVNFIENITAGLTKRYFIKGRAGTGKSTLQKKLITTAQERGFDMEIYYCGFDPKSIDMVVFRELGTAIFDSTSPHELFPSREGDEIIDMYAKTVARGTDERYKNDIEAISSRYKEKMHKGTEGLAHAKRVRAELETIYTHAMDFSQVEQIRAEIEAELLRISER